MDDAFACAIRLLARREHSVYELRLKLAQKGYAQQASEAAIARCQHLDYQSDARYAEQMCRTRVRQGYGPLRIEQELLQAKVDASVVNEVLTSEKAHWFERASSVLQRKLNDGDAPTFEAMQKYKRFLLYRGFSYETIAQVFKQLEAFYPNNESK